ncbi:unnamed protein product [Leuciscus chuanchicus]
MGGRREGMNEEEEPKDREMADEERRKILTWEEVKGAGDLECLGALVSHSCISLPVSEGNGQMMDERKEIQKIDCLAGLREPQSYPSPDLHHSGVALQRDGNSNPEMMS